MKIVPDNTKARTYAEISAEYVPMGSSFEDRELRERSVCLLIAMGDPVEQVAQKLRMAPSAVYALMESKKGAELILKLGSIAHVDPQDRITRLAGLAIDVQTRLLLTGSDAIKARLSDSIIDRAQGKATQITENRNLNVNVNDVPAIDRALAAQKERLQKLVDMEATIVEAVSKSPVARVERERQAAA